jgi:hypothetical protein
LQHRNLHSKCVCSIDCTLPPYYIPCVFRFPAISVTLFSVPFNCTLPRAPDMQVGGSRSAAVSRRGICPPSAIFGALLDGFPLGKNTADSEDGKNPISPVHQSCPALLIPKHETHRHRRGKLDCERVCQPILDINSSYCLCACSFHREECPVHRLA